FRSISKSKTRLGRRRTILTAIDDALDEAHLETDPFLQCRALIVVRLCCEAWLRANPNKTAYRPAKYIGKGTGSHRYDGVMALSAEIDNLLTTTYAQPFGTAKRMMGYKDKRIKNRKVKTLSGAEYYAEFQDPQHRSKATLLKQ